MRRGDSTGFTVVELLVVVVIMALLLAVIFDRANEIRKKGYDGSVRGQLSLIQPRAAQLFSDYGCYAADSACTVFSLGTCSTAAGSLFADEKIRIALNAAIVAAGNEYGAAAASACATVYNSGATDRPYSYAIIVRLPSSRTATGAYTQAWCIDSSGASKVQTSTNFNTATQIRSKIVHPASSASNAVACI